MFPGHAHAPSRTTWWQSSDWTHNTWEGVTFSVVAQMAVFRAFLYFSTMVQRVCVRGCSYYFDSFLFCFVSVCVCVLISHLQRHLPRPAQKNWIHGKKIFWPRWPTLFFASKRTRGTHFFGHFLPTRLSVDFLFLKRIEHEIQRKSHKLVLFQQIIKYR